MTDLAERAICFIDAFIGEFGYAPSLNEIGRAIGMRTVEFLKQRGPSKLLILPRRKTQVTVLSPR